MTSIGGNVKARTVECDNLETNTIAKINTSNKIDFLSNDETRWSMGLDVDNNFVLKNEIADVNSFIASNDTGLCTILGGGGSNDLLSLNDVESVDISNEALMYYDEPSQKFKFATDISLSKLQVSGGVETNLIFSNDPIKIKFYGNISTNFVENDYVVFNKNTIKALDSFGSDKNIIMGDISVNNCDASNVNISDKLECAKIKYADNIVKQSFNKVNASGSDTVHTLASFRVQNESTGYNFGHIHLHFVIQQYLFQPPYGGGDAHINISFEPGFTSWAADKHLEKINTDGHLHSVEFKVSFTIPDIINITYQNSDNNITSVAGVVEFIVANALITPI